MVQRVTQPFRLHSARSLPFPVLAVAGSTIVAAASLAFAVALSYDAWGWLLWGQEIVGGRTFTTDGYPTWKPLTGLISLFLAPLGGAAPTLWLLIARTGAVLAVVLAYRLAARLAGWPAGVIAAVALVIAPEWLFQAGVGGSEGLLTALLLAAVDRHVDRHDRSGFLLVMLASLLRPESWPALLVSGMVLWRRRPGSRALVLAGVAAVPVLWFGGEYLGSGDPFRGGQLARTSLEARQLQHGSVPPAVGVLDRAWRMVALPVLACVPAALVYAFRRRDPIVPGLALAGLAWTAEVAILAALGYAGVTRFLFPATAALAVAGAVGLVQLLHSTKAAPAAGVVLVIVLAALTVPSADRVTGLQRQARRIDERAQLDAGIERIVARAGRQTFLNAPNVWAEGVTRTPLAWHLGVSSDSILRARLPALALANLNQRWPRFRRALQRGRRRFTARILLSDGDLRLISVEHRRTP